MNIDMSKVKGKLGYSHQGPHGQWAFFPFGMVDLLWGIWGGWFPGDSFLGG